MRVNGLVAKTVKTFAILAVVRATFLKTGLLPQRNAAALVINVILTLNEALRTR